MAANGVNLDALIQREDLEVVSRPLGGKPTGEVGIAILKDEIFLSGLRKPNFQRETANWSPQKIADIVAAFLDGDLIPAIILWRSGQYTFVVDGAHRLSAILAWLYDDYGDKSRSINFFDNKIPQEQLDLAKKTRALVDSTAGSHSALQDMAKNRHHLSEKMKVRLSNYANNSFVVQWVPEVGGAEGAEKSFFKINQAPTPVDQTEKKILKGRHAAVAIASRAINRGGVGHKYWGHFEPEARNRIEALGKDIYNALYSPALSVGPVKTSDVPIAGQGYSSLPFVFDLVSLINNVAKSAMLEKDADGSLTIRYMEEVWRRLTQITTNQPGSLGLHPLVYFYTRGGAFQPVAFLASTQVVNRLLDRGEADRFCEVRERLERFLIRHKEAFTLIVKSQGSGPRSRPALEAFLESAIRGISQGQSEQGLISEMAEDSRFRFLAAPQPIRGAANTARAFDSSAKSAAFISNLSGSGVRCGICRGLLHSNSMTVDHVTRREDGGGAHFKNAQMSYPYCNSGFKEGRIARSLTLVNPHDLVEPNDRTS